MDIQSISKRMTAGFVSLTARRIILYGLSFATINLLLARLLPVSTIGIFNIANSILAVFTFFSDIGLAAAIIQKKELDEDDLKTTFTIQEVLAALLTIIVWFSAPILASMYHLDQEGMWLVRVLGIGFFLTSLKVIPSVRLERELKFQPLVWVEVIETVVFNGVLVGLVLANLGIAAFSWAVIFRSLIGVGVIYLLAPWKIALGFSKQAARTLLSFGVPFQLNSLLALLKDRMVPLVVAQIVGSVGVGYISWAQSLAFLPLEVMNIVIRVTFPAYSRLQDNKEYLEEMINKSLFLTTVFMYPMLFGLIAIFPSLVEHVVSDKWKPAMPLFYLFCFSTFWASLSTTFTNILNATGRIKTTLKLMIMWTILTWVLSPILVLIYGFIGAAISSAVISFTSIITIVIIKKVLNIEIIKSIWQPLLAGVLMAVPTFFLSQSFAHDLASLLVVVAGGGIIYFALIVAVARDKIFSYVEKFGTALS